MQFAEFIADGNDAFEFFLVFGIRNTREIDFQEFLVFFTIGWSVENAVDVIKDLFRSRFKFSTLVYFAPDFFV